jgi:hypothetical protein
MTQPHFSTHLWEGKKKVRDEEWRDPPTFTFFLTRKPMCMLTYQQLFCQVVQLKAEAQLPIYSKLHPKTLPLSNLMNEVREKYNRLLG